MIRLAKMSDLEQIMAVVKESVAMMLAQSNDQWNEQYPIWDDFAKDISAESLYAAERDGMIMGFICLNQEDGENYHLVDWARAETKGLVVHRMAVNPKFRRQGIGEALFAFAEMKARQLGLDYMKTDTYYCNQPMQALLTKMGYVKRGEVYFSVRDGAFFCYDKML